MKCQVQAFLRSSAVCKSLSVVLQRFVVTFKAAVAALLWDKPNEPVWLSCHYLLQHLKQADHPASHPICRFLYRFHYSRSQNGISVGNKLQQNSPSAPARYRKLTSRSRSDIYFPKVNEQMNIDAPRRFLSSEEIQCLWLEKRRGHESCQINNDESASVGNALFMSFLGYLDAWHAAGCRSAAPLLETCFQKGGRVDRQYHRRAERQTCVHLLQDRPLQLSLKEASLFHVSYFQFCFPFYWHFFFRLFIWICLFFLLPFHTFSPRGRHLAVFPVCRSSKLVDSPSSVVISPHLLISHTYKCKNTKKRLISQVCLSYYATLWECAITHELLWCFLLFNEL